MSYVDHFVRVCMPYFHFFVLGVWTLVIAWFVAAIYVQSRAEKTQSSLPSEQPEPSPQSQAWRLPIVTRSMSAAD